MRPSAVEYQFEFNMRWNHNGKQMVCSWRSLICLTEVSIGGEQMKIADGIVCYSIAISDCVKEPNSLMALTFFKKTDQCSMFKDQIVFKTTTSACNKSMSWIVVLHLLY